VTEAFWGPRIERLLRQRNCRLILHGQYHSTRALKVGPITILGMAPVTMGGIDTSPRGCALLTLDEREVATLEIRPISSIDQRPAATAAAMRTGSRTALTEGVPRFPGFERRWSVKLPAAIHRAPVVSVDGHSLVTLGDHPNPLNSGIVALDNRSGALEWRVATDSTVKGGPALATGDHERLLYVVSVAGRVYAISLDGRTRWTRDLPNFPDRWIYTVPLFVDGTIVIGQYSGHAAFESTSGKSRWQEGPQWEDGWSPVYQHAACRDGVYYSMTTKSLGLFAVTARRTTNGELLWSRRLDYVADPTERVYQLAHASPELGTDMLFVSGLRDRVLALRPQTGETLWESHVVAEAVRDSGVRTTTYLTSDAHLIGLTAHGGTLFASTTNGVVAAIDASTGRVLWRHQAGRAPLLDFLPYFRGRGSYLAAPTLWNGRVLLGSADGFLYVLDARSGDSLAEVPFGSPITSPIGATEQGITVCTFGGLVSRYEPS
jgi:outer membrane protein assembly factor BamB